MPQRSRVSSRAFLLAMALAVPSFSGAQADDIMVAASIAPVHSLAMLAAGDRATVTLLVPPEISPHDFAMKPSTARALSESDLVIRVGAGLDGFLESSIETLSGDAQVVTLGEIPGVELLPSRTKTHWETHDDEAHDESHGDNDDDHHADGDAEAHESSEENAHTEHDEEHEDDHHDAHDDHDEHSHHDHHDHGPNDPHLWLDPANARVGLAAISEALSKLDPAGADVYAANAAAADAKLAELQLRMAERLGPVSDRPYAVFHDAYQYLEHRFDLTALGSISGIDGAAPSPRRLREIQASIRESNAVCVFSEPQFDTRLLEAVTEGTGAKNAVLDPLGATIPPGPQQYIGTMDALTDSLANCLK